VSQAPSRVRAGRWLLAGLLAVGSVGWVGEGNSVAAAPAELISVDPVAGGPMASQDTFPSVSGDGNIVVFTATSFPAEVRVDQVFVRNRATGVTTPVPATDPPTSRTMGGVVSRDGCHVVFWGLFFFDFPAGEWDIFSWNRCANTPPVEIGFEVLPPSVVPDPFTEPLAVSADGRYVAYVAQEFASINPPPTIARIDTSTGFQDFLFGTPQITFASSLDISDDGKFIAIGGERGASAAGVPNQQVIGWTPPCASTCTTELISVNDAGAQATGFNGNPSVSADGRYVAFTSNGPELAGISTPVQVYVRDRIAKVTRLVSDTPGKPRSAFGDDNAEISPDGLQIALTESTASETNEVFVARSASGFFDTSNFDLVSFGVSGAPVSSGADSPSMSSNGRFVAFSSFSNDELSGGTVPNTSTEIWMRDRPIALDITPTINFGTVNVGAQSPPQNAVVTNTSQVPVNIGSVVPPAAPFSITGSSCGGVLNPGDSCTVTIVFTPTAGGSASSSVTVLGDGLSVSVSLIGTGRQLVGVLSISPGSANFGAATVGDSLPPRTFTVSNTGASAVAFSGLGLSGGGADQFTIVSTTCAVSLAVGANCVVGVSATVTRVGASSATLAISGTGGQLAQASLRVTGRPATFHPVLKMNPGVVAAGGVTAVIGSAFPPNIDVQLAFENEPAFTTVHTDGDGAFRFDFLILRNGVRIGGRQVVVVAPAEFNNVRAPLLIDLATYRPSGFSSPAITSGVRSLVSRGG